MPRCILQRPGEWLKKLRCLLTYLVPWCDLGKRTHLSGPGQFSSRYHY